MRLKVGALPGFREDFSDLPGDEVRRAALSNLGDVANHDTHGAPLAARVSTGDLGDCRKLYFNVAGYTGKPRYRLVFRILPNEAQAVAVESVSVGQRADMDAYARATRNLGRS